MNNKKHFASFGGEKMIYDDRMKPQAVYHEGRLYVVYQANSDGKKQAHPFMTHYDMARNQWSVPTQLGSSSGIDHHFAPILWLDQEKRFHLLYDCHFGKGTHMISTTPLNGSSWDDGPIIAPSITYPRIWQLRNNKTLMMHRVGGHLGYWVYKLSDDGGMTWNEPTTIIDFDKEAQDDQDEWAGSYLGAAPSIDGKRLHLGFIYWDERHNANPHYKFKKDLFSRYNLYYVILDLRTGEMRNTKGDIMSAPINRKAASDCMILDTGHELTNFPFVFVNKYDKPYFLAPVSMGSPWECTFDFFKMKDGAWQRTHISTTDNIWAGSYLEERKDGTLHAYIIAGKGKGESTFYGGGSLEHWISQDDGDSWNKLGILDPDTDLIYNNPRPVVTSEGELMEGKILFYGWKGPEGIWNIDSMRPNRGRLYLWDNGKFVCP